MVLDSGIFVVIAAVALSTIMTEVVLYLWVYRTPSFRAVRDQLELFQQSQDSLAAGPKLRNKGRKAEREEDRLKREVTKEMSKLRLKQAVVVSILLSLILFMHMPRAHVHHCSPRQACAAPWQQL